MSTVSPSIRYDPEAREQRLRELLAKLRQCSDDCEAMRELTELLPEEDGIPMETLWHRDAMTQLSDALLE